MGGLNLNPSSVPESDLPEREACRLGLQVDAAWGTVALAGVNFHEDDLERNKSSRGGSAADLLLRTFDLEGSPVLKTSAACQSGMAFLELRCDVSNFGITDVVKEDAVLFALQLVPFPDFDIFADGKHFRGTGFRAGVMAMFDLNAGPAADLKEPFHAMNFLLPRAAIDAVTDDAGVPRMGEFPLAPGAVADDAVARGLLLAMRPALGAPVGHTSHLFVDHIAMAMAAHVVARYGGVRMKGPRARGGLAPFHERRVKELMRANLNGNIGLEELALACGLSVRHFTRAFKASVGMTAHEWLTLQRVETAKGLLAESSLSLAEVAFDCGFADASHFGRAFMRAVGATPGNWRRINRR